MKSFADYVSGRRKKFVGLLFTDESQSALQKWAFDNGFDLTTKFSGEKQAVTDFDFHTTIFYTTTEHDTKEGVMSVDPFELKFNKFELLGMNHNIPVLKIDTNNKPLMNIRTMFQEMGYRDQWPEYKPHITLSYNYSGSPDLKSLEIPQIKVVANKIKISDQTG